MQAVISWSIDSHTETSKLVRHLLAGATQPSNLPFPNADHTWLCYHRQERGSSRAAYQPPDQLERPRRLLRSKGLLQSPTPPLPWSSPKPRRISVLTRRSCWMLDSRRPCSKWTVDRIGGPPTRNWYTAIVQINRCMSYYPAKPSFSYSSHRYCAIIDSGPLTNPCQL